MIFNVVGVMKTDNIRDIILFEAYSNFTKNIYFGIWIIKLVEVAGVFPQGYHGFSSVHT